MQIQTFACVLAGLLALSCTFQTVLTESEPERMKSMADTLRMLQNLDKYYAQVARPRFGKRGDYPRFQEQVLNGDDIPVPDQRLWDRLVR